MKIILESKNPSQVQTPALCVFITDKLPTLKDQSKILKHVANDTTDGKISILHTNGSAKRILLANITNHKKNNDVIRHVSGILAKKIQELKLKEFTIIVPDEFKQDLFIQEIITGIIPALHTFNKFKTKKESSPQIMRICACKNEANQKSIKRSKIIAQSVVFTKDTCNLPPNECSPQILSNIAKNVANKNKIKCTILSKPYLKKNGFGGITAVGQGSKNEPKLIILEYKGGKQKPILLVGKAVTFDTGGISIKPSERMEEMKFDKCGGCTILGIIKAISELKLQVNVVGLIPAVENMPSGDAYRPGDIIKLYNGKTAEIQNTDAEGRLILADALAFGEAKFTPRAIIDLATLTGACIVSLGNNVAGLVSNNDKLANIIFKSSNSTAEKVWRLPLDDDYMDMIKSDFADIKNVGVGRTAGTITAAAFLKNAIKDTPWAHIDIAGTAWTQTATKYRSYNPKGATAFGVRLILDCIEKI